ncbi:MAG: GntR family transcriptional regulator [Culicoidibacterales bacterium]
MVQSNTGYQFIAHQIKTQINSSIYQKDDKLPSVRELASLYNANTKTIQRAIKVLETEGFIYTVPGLGTFVHGDIENSKQDFQSELFLSLQESVHKLRQASIAEEDIKKQFIFFLEEEMPDEHTI